MSVLTSDDIAEFRALAEDLGFPDSYQLMATTKTTDGAGGTTGGTPAAIESGGCSLTMGLTRPEERAIADRAGYQSPYIIELPYDTQAKPRHQLKVNGSRTFQIAGVLKDGNWGITARAICQENG